MPAGPLRERCAIQAESTSDDGMGGQTLSWSTSATVWARVTPIGGREQVQAQQVQDSVTHRVTIRYRPGLNAGMRLLWGSKPLNIRAVTNPDEKKKYLELLTEEGVAI